MMWRRGEGMVRGFSMVAWGDHRHLGEDGKGVG
jgi:hypothetical protein